MNDKELLKAIYSLTTFLLTYETRGKSVMDIFDDWLSASKFIFTDKEAMKETFLCLNDYLRTLPLIPLIELSESEMIPDYKDFMKYDNPLIFENEN